MRLFKDKSEKAIFAEYCNLYSKWFNREIPMNAEINTKGIIELIRNEYSSMSEEQIKIELISLKERIEINKIRRTNATECCFYNLCMDVLNHCVDSKLRKKASIDDGFLVDLSDWIFGTLEKMSIFNIVRKLKHTTSYKFVDLWIIGNLIAAILSSILVYNLTIKNKYLVCIILIYSILRVFEVIIYQINVLLFHPYRAKKEGEEYKIKSVTRMVIALLYNYIEIMFWYSTMIISIIIFNGENPYNLTWIEIIKSNILCIITLDGNLVKETVNSSYEYLSFLVFLEIISGMIMTIISLARFIGALPEADSKE
jgi:hypothetical protein